MSTHNQKHKRFVNSKLATTGDRRLVPDGRKFTYTEYIPERRSGIDRRNETHRRKEVRFRKAIQVTYSQMSSSLQIKEAKENETLKNV